MHAHSIAKIPDTHTILLLLLFGEVRSRIAGARQAGCKHSASRQSETRETARACNVVPANQWRMGATRNAKDTSM